MNGMPVMRDTARPIVDLPQPMYPMRNIGCISVVIIVRCKDSKKGANQKNASHNSHALHQEVGIEVVGYSVV